jgi:phage baseplate assembly protein W
MLRKSTISNFVAIKIPNLQQLKDAVVDELYYFKDLHLDFEKSSNFNYAFNERIETNDIKVDYDELAIKNSLKNIFNTKPGQRFLFPLFGLDLYQFLFSPVTSSNGQIIGEKIITAIEEYEQRVYVNRCLVEADPENNKYEITLIVEIPELKKTIPIYTNLDLKSQSFIFIENARNK